MGRLILFWICVIVKMSLAFNVLRSKFTPNQSATICRVLNSPKLGQNPQVRRSFMTSLDTGAKTPPKSLTRIIWPYRVGAAAGVVGLNAFLFGVGNTNLATKFEEVVGVQWCVFNFALNFFIGVPLLYTIFAVTFPF